MKNIVIALILLMSFTGVSVQASIIVGAARTDVYVPLLKGKKVGLLSNHTGMVGDRHTLDIMLAEGIEVVTIFSPEHGFRGTADAGEKVGNSCDLATGLPIVSMYSAGKKGIDPEVLKPLDVVVVDMQDVGTRFYTYYITMIKLMEEVAPYGVEVMIFDRPNPLGMTVDGPVLDMTLRSGVGRLPIPVLHGMTLGELAKMAVGEKWLKDGAQVKLTVVPCLNYTHESRYTLTVAPSPNLRTMKAIYLYPSLCYFEGTPVSVGRGTESPFMVFGHPSMKYTGFYFVPKSVEGAKNPPLLGRKCHGVDLTSVDDEAVIKAGVDLRYVITAYKSCRLSGTKFFTSFFDKLMGNTKVRRMILQGKSAADIKASWRDEVEQFKKLREPYLIYPLQ